MVHRVGELTNSALPVLVRVGLKLKQVISIYSICADFSANLKLVPSVNVASKARRQFGAKYHNIFFMVEPLFLES